MTMPDGPSFQFRRHRFEFEVLTPVYFPPLKAENILRGMAGLLLPRAAPELAGPILHPVWPNAPSGYATPPTVNNLGPSPPTTAVNPLWWTDVAHVRFVNGTENGTGSGCATLASSPSARRAARRSC